MLIYNPIYIP